MASALTKSGATRFRRATSLLLAGGLVCCVAASTTAGERKVLTIAIDGLRPDALLAANAPNVDSLVDGTFFGTSGPSGIFVTYAQSEHLTFSGPGWGAYMTGLHVDRHGADTNGFENVVPGTTDWFTPLEALDPTLNTRRVITWQIAHDSIPSGADIAEVYEYSSNGDQLMTNRVVNLMQDPATDAVMTFFSDVDSAGHSCGFDPTNACYLAEIADTDAQIGQIMTAMAARPNFANEDWLVILTTDHGGLGTNHHGGNAAAADDSIHCRRAAGDNRAAASASAPAGRGRHGAHLFRRAASPATTTDMQLDLSPLAKRRPRSARTWYSTATPNTTAASAATTRNSTRRAGMIRARVT